MTHILLTGAGFSRNWGGWLASEAFEYLLGCSEIDQETRRLLWRSKENGAGFEDTLADLANAKDAQGKKRYDDLTAALVGMFNAMTQGFMQRQFDFLQGDVRRTVKRFLVQFDAIFTLNQDTLLEQHYLDQVVSEKWNGVIIPGVKPLGSATAVPIQFVKIAPQQPDADNFKLPPRIQPYIKLHGSCNWNDGTSGGRILIMGGQKAISIDQFPILTWYHQQFREFLLRPDARLMVIGCSFSDAHINTVIGDGVDKGLKLFIIDPLGVDVLDKRQKEPVGRVRDEYMDKLTPNIIGASRRPLTSIFFEDVVEHGRVMKFFT
jgi:SIR2-like domain